MLKCTGCDTTFNYTKDADLRHLVTALWHAQTVHGDGSYDRVHNYAKAVLAENFKEETKNG